MKNKEIIIWGAGKIGRGFIADLAQAGEYKITFVDADEALVKELNAKKAYSVCKFASSAQKEVIKVSGFDAMHTSEAKPLLEKLVQGELLALAVFPESFNEVGLKLSQVIGERIARKIEKPLDILICTNIANSETILKKYIIENLNGEALQYFNTWVGLIGSIVIRMAVKPEKEHLEKDKLVVVTNGYPELIADKSAFKGELPAMPGMVFTENILVQEKRKMYTYNMLHALYAYIGFAKGYEFVYECTTDAEINRIANYALDEIKKGLLKEYNFSAEDMDLWNKRVLQNMANPILKDRLIRVGGDAARKLKREDRLVGAALLCRQNGVLPYFITMAIAYGYLFKTAEDPASLKIDKHIKKYGLKRAVVEFSQLSYEPDLVQLIFEHYSRALKGETHQFSINKINKLKFAFERGFYNEKKYRGCGQCAIKGLLEVLDSQDDVLFQATSGLSGGGALCNDGSCGGYIAGILLMSKIVGRRLEQMLVDGDKEAQYRSYTMAQKLHDKFIDTYGSVVCKDIHERIFGQWFCLREKAVRDRFEIAGAHLDKCTSVIGVSVTWVTEILIEEGFIKV